MSRLRHSPARIIHQLLLDLELVTDPEDGDAWPGFYRTEPDTPDDLVTVFNTLGRQDGRSNIDGYVFEHKGFQVKVRSGGNLAEDLAYDKASEIADALDRLVVRAEVTIESSIYYIQCISRTGDIMSLGLEPATGRRHAFTINAVAPFRLL